MFHGAVGIGGMRLRFLRASCVFARRKVAASREPGPCVDITQRQASVPWTRGCETRRRPPDPRLPLTKNKDRVRSEELEGRLYACGHLLPLSFAAWALDGRNGTVAQREGHQIGHLPAREKNHVFWSAAKNLNNTHVALY